MVPLFIKIFITPFYKAHLIFYAFLLMACVGVVNRASLLPYHRFIMQTLLQQPFAFGGVLLLWLLYNQSCVSFCKRQFKAPESSFLYELQCLPATRQMQCYLFVHLLLLMPFLVYASIFITVAFHEQYVVVGLAVILFWIAVIIFSVRYLYRVVNSSWIVRKPLLMLRYNKPARTKNLNFLLLHYLNEERKMFVLLLKLFSSLLLYAVLVWNEGGFGRDIFVMVFQLLLLAHTPLPYLCVRFMEQRFSVYRNLPLRASGTAFNYITCYAVLFLPELLFLFVKQPAIFSRAELLLLYSICVTTLFLLTAVLYGDNLKKEDYYKVVFMLLFVSTFALNAGYFISWLGIATGIGTLLFARSYHHYTPADGP